MTGIMTESFDCDVFTNYKLQLIIYNDIKPFFISKMIIYHIFFSLFTCNNSCARLRRVQSLLKTDGLDGLLCILGMLHLERFCYQHQSRKAQSPAVLGSMKPQQMETEPIQSRWKKFPTKDCFPFPWITSTCLPNLIGLFFISFS